MNTTPRYRGIWVISAITFATCTLPLAAAEATGPGTRAAQTNENGIVTVTFSAQSGAPVPESSELVLGMVAAEGLDGAGFLTVQVQALDSSPGVLRLCLATASGRVWTRALPPSAPGGWTTYTVPLSYSAGWTIGPWKTPSLFAADRAMPATVSLYVARSADTALQRIRITGLASESPGWGEGDTDADGVDNAHETAAGTNPFDAKSRLAIRRLDTDSSAGGITLTWDSTAERRYSVARATNLLDGFTPMQSGIPAVPPSNTFKDSGATGSGPYFYRITVDNPLW